LQADEGVVGGLGELDVPQHGARDQRSHPGRGLGDGDGVHLVFGHVEAPEMRHRLPPAEHVELQGNSFEAEHVVLGAGRGQHDVGRRGDAGPAAHAVGRDLYLELRRLVFGPIRILLGVLVQFYAEVEA